MENSYNLRIKSIINFHDVMHKSHPEYLKKTDLIMRNIIYQNCSNSSDFIIASSKTMKKEYKNLMRLNENKIILINEGVDKNNFLKKNNKKNKTKIFFLPCTILEAQKSHSIN